jgi:hypothetical protein
LSCPREAAARKASRRPGQLPGSASPQNPPPSSFLLPTPASTFRQHNLSATRNTRCHPSPNPSAHYCRLPYYRCRPRLPSSDDVRDLNSAPSQASLPLCTITSDCPRPNLVHPTFHPSESTLNLACRCLAAQLACAVSHPVRSLPAGLACDSAPSNPCSRTFFFFFVPTRYSLYDSRTSQPASPNANPSIIVIPTEYPAYTADTSSPMCSFSSRTTSPLIFHLSRRFWFTTLTNL